MKVDHFLFVILINECGRLLFIEEISGKEVEVVLEQLLEIIEERNACEKGLLKPVISTLDILLSLFMNEDLGKLIS